MSSFPVYLALGSNLDNREKNLQDAIQSLNNQCSVSVVVSSDLYKTEPKYVTNQPDFLNIVIEGATELGAIALLNVCKEIERKMGRKFQEKRYGPRIIDIDILFYGSEIITEELLIIPHPKIAERRFVLEPLEEIAGGFVHPGLHITVSELLNKCKDSCHVHKIKSTHSWISH